jgi:hypothetical protein
MCARQNMALQRGMYFRSPPAHGIILMSRRKNAPYDDTLSPDEQELIYEGHDIFKTDGGPDPKSVDQPRYRSDGSRTPNGDFADWTDAAKAGNEEPAVFRVYEKLRPGIWSDRGLYLLKDYRVEPSNSRSVFKFILHQADFDNTGPRVWTAPERSTPAKSPHG